MSPRARTLPILVAAATLLGPSLSSAQSSRQPPPVEVGLALRQLDGVKRVMMIAAHPDDEDTALLAALARGWGARAAYVSLTRGEGGQNLIGVELGEGLGLIRSGELLAARTIDGAEQYFSRAYDFGFSKTAEEAFSHWPRDSLLADLVQAIRTFRPQVIVSVFSGTPADGHGQHQVAGILAREAFDAAGDPSRFPGQLAAGLEPWTPLKLYRRTFFDPEAATMEVATGRLDPLLGRSHHQIAMDSRSQHRSQDFGTAQSPGPRASRLALLATRVPSTDTDPILAGVDTTLAALVGPAHRDAAAEYRLALARARDALGVFTPGAALAPLAEASRALDRLRTAIGAPRGSEIGAELDRRRRILDTALLAAAEIRVEWRARDDVLVPGQALLVEARVWNSGDGTIEVRTPTLALPEGWTVEAVPIDADTPPEDAGPFGGFFSASETLADPAPDARTLIPPDAMRLWRFRVHVAVDAPPSSPYFLRTDRAGDIYRWPDAMSLRTRPFAPPLATGSVGLTLDAAGAIAVRSNDEVRFRGVDKAMGEFWRPLRTAPRVAVRPMAETLVWPLADSTPRVVQVRLTNRDPEGANGTIEIEAAPGWRVEPAARAFAFTEPEEETQLAFTLHPTGDAREGEVRLGVTIDTGGGPVRATRIQSIDYPHIEPRFLASPAEIRIVRFPVRVADRRVGYVMGSGDGGIEAIRALGLDVEPIEPDDWSAEHLDRFDTIVLGVRAYEVRTDLIAHNPLLLEWVEHGGTLVVQYNKYEWNDGPYAPYPLEIGQPAPRVTDERAAVTVRPEAGVAATTPNRLTSGDFDGWVQERGLYFPTEWDDRYTALLEMNDPGEPPRLGSLLVAPSGEGLYVHTSLSFFRQLPAGVPGAYRLWANLLSLDGERWRRGVTASQF